jgi:hypothetical protein
MVKHNTVTRLPKVVPLTEFVKDVCLESIIKLPLKQGKLGEQRLCWNLSIVTCTP